MGGVLRKQRNPDKSRQLYGATPVPHLPQKSVLHPRQFSNRGNYD